MSSPFRGYTHPRACIRASPSAGASHLTFGGCNVFRNRPFNRLRRQPPIAGNRNATNDSSIYAAETADTVDYERGIRDNKIANRSFLRPESMFARNQIPPFGDRQLRR